jgi:hypothetical protein
MKRKINNKNATPKSDTPKKTRLNTNNNIARNILKEYSLIQNRIQKQNMNFLNNIMSRVKGDEKRFNKVIAILERNAPFELY